MTVYELTNETVTFEDLSSKLSNDSLTVFRLKDVKVSGSERDAINMSKTIRGHPNLQEFSLTNVEVLDAAVDLDPVVSMLLVTVTTLKTLRLENAPITMSALSTIGYCTTLKELFMPNSGLKDEDATIIAAGIAQNQSIETVDLTGNGVSDVGGLAFTKALEKNLSLQVLRLDGNGISSESCSAIQGTLQARAATAA